MRTERLPQGTTSSRRVEKSAAAFRTISEVADELEVQQHVLRFWETKFNQVRPLKRGGGRRYYRPEDVQLLKHIRGLLYDEGYTIKGVQRLLREGSLKPEVIASVKRPHTLRDGDEPSTKAPTSPPVENGGTATVAPAATGQAPQIDPAPHESGAETSADAVRGELREILAELKALRAMLPVRSS